MSDTIFDRWASNYDRSVLQPAYRSAHRAVLRGARSLAAAPRTVLDVGCGTGHLLRDALEIFPDAILVGIDPSARMLAVSAAHDGGSGPVRVQATAERLPFADGVFDMALSTSSWRHWRDQVVGVAEIARVLVPGGLVGFADVVGLPRVRLIGRHRYRLPATMTVAFAAAGLIPTDIDLADGYGPVGAVSVVLAHRTRGGRPVPA